MSARFAQCRPSWRRSLIIGPALLVEGWPRPSSRPSRSTDGTNWTTVGTAPLPSAASAEDVGLFDTAATGGSEAAGLTCHDGFTIG